MEIFGINLFIIIGVLILVGLLVFFAAMTRYKKCKPNEMLVVYGKAGGGKERKTAKIIQGGAAFVWPFIQGYEFMSMQPIPIQCNLNKILSSQNIRVSIPANITVAISTVPDIRQNAAERLLGLDEKEKVEQIQKIILGQMRDVISTMSIEALNNQREEFLKKAKVNIDSELNKIGLYLMNINMEDINDEADYIANLGKKETAKAKNQALAEIEEQEKLGQIRIAEQRKEKETQVAETTREKDVAIAETTKERDIKVAEANKIKESSVAKANAEKESNIADAEAERDIRVAKAKQEAALGSNLAEEEIAKSEAKLKVTQAQAIQEAEAARERAAAEVERQKQAALKEAERARAEKVEQQLVAEKIVPAEIAKKEAILKAQQMSEAARTQAAGESDAILLKAKAEAEAVRLKGEAEGAAKAALLQAEVDAYAGKLAAADAHPEIAVQMQIVDKVNYTEIAGQQVKAFERMNLGNINIYDTGNGESAGNFMKGIVDKVAPALGVMNSLPLPDAVKKYIAPGNDAQVVTETQTTSSSNTKSKPVSVSPKQVKFNDVK